MDTASKPLLRADAASFGRTEGSGPSLSSFTLDNGLDVVVIPDRRVPVVTHMVWYRNGSADDPLGQSGIAHFLEHLMFKGTEKHPAGEFSKVVSGLGGQENAFTSFVISAGTSVRFLIVALTSSSSLVTAATTSDDSVNARCSSATD